MQKTVIILIIVLLGAGVAMSKIFNKGDKKEDIAASVPPVKKNIKLLPLPDKDAPKIKRMDFGKTVSASYTYDELGRITSLQYSGGDKMIYLYNGSYLTEKAIDKNGSLLEEKIYELDINGLAIRATLSGSPFENSFEYNEEGQLIKDHQAMGAGIFEEYRYFYSASGVMDSMHYFTQNGFNSRTIYQFDTSKINTVGNINTGLLFLGRDSKGLLLKQSTYSSGTSKPVLKTYHYEFDSKRRIIRNLSPSMIINFTYNP